MLLVGTSGWSYADWVGPVYPPELKERRGAWLEHYAQRFATVEVNSTFYRLPEPRVVEGWVEKAGRVGGDFEFSLKAPQDVTHTAMVEGDEAMVKEVLDQFHSLALEPLREAGLLGAVLLQLSPRFRGGEEQLRLLRLAVEGLAGRGVEVAVEFRHRTWLEGRALAPEALALLEERGAALCAVDGPSFPPMLRGTASHAYVRFHGRRADMWFARGRQRTTEDDLPARYDYLYAAQELEPWARVLRENETRFAKVRVYFNNHPRGQAVRNAEDMMRLLGVAPPQRVPGKAPAKRDGAQRSLAEF